MVNCRADDVASDFSLRGFQVQSIHGDRFVQFTEKFLTCIYVYGSNVSKIHT